MDQHSEAPGDAVLDDATVGRLKRLVISSYASLSPYLRKAKRARPPKTSSTAIPWITSLPGDPSRAIPNRRAIPNDKKTTAASTTEVRDQACRNAPRPLPGLWNPVNHHQPRSTLNPFGLLAAHQAGLEPPRSVPGQGRTYKAHHRPTQVPVQPMAIRVHSPVCAGVRCAPVRAQQAKWGTNDHLNDVPVTRLSAVLHVISRLSALAVMQPSPELRSRGRAKHYVAESATH